MAVIFDTAGLPASDRAEAVYDAMMSATAPCHVIHENPDAPLHFRIEVWAVGDVEIFTNRSSGLRLLRTAKQARHEPMPVIAISVQRAGQGLLEQWDQRRSFTPGEMLAVDLSAPYDFSWSGTGAAGCVQIRADMLDLPADMVHRGCPQLQRSPLYPLLTDHIRHLTRDPGAVTGLLAQSSLGAATLELARALLASAAGDSRHARAALAESLLTRVRAYVRRHLRDGDLSPASIAAAHSISVRYLYKLCAAGNFSLEQWIIAERLKGACSDLAAPGETRSVAAIARAWGFSDPAHFTRRFRATFQCTPTDWRHAERRHASQRPAPDSAPETDR
ncbi:MULTISPECIES: helix-turn-helix domain-containing protein [Streptacidiphilus]|uniref:Helix-turn-helix domain-containing protein n=1 Tax=Streptacidiphilus cavernicola TaxID=3342716 RepID=A0ABV6UVX4_9ACTN|nr:helix-turn-helix domain-containing protein [Streptacidiphilus jeojiense]